jgi:hypothetical protein
MVWHHAEQNKMARVNRREKPQARPAERPPQLPVIRNTLQAVGAAM